MTDASVVRWQAPELGACPTPAQEAEQSLADELERRYQEAAERGYRDGYDKGLVSGKETGHTAGFVAGEVEVRKLIAQITGLLDGFERPLARLDGEVTEAMADLSLRVCQALLGREYRRDPEALMPVIQSGLDIVSGTERNVELRLHPDDAGLLSPYLATVDARIVPDDSLVRGDMRLHTPSVRIDGTIDSRLKACFSAMAEDRQVATA